MAAHYKTKTSTPFIKIKQLGRLLRPLGGRMPSRPACPLNPRSPGSTTIRIKPKIYAIFDIIVFHLVSVNKNKNLENFLVTLIIGEPQKNPQQDHAAREYTVRRYYAAVNIIIEPAAT